MGRGMYWGNASKPFIGNLDSDYWRKYVLLFYMTGRLATNTASGTDGSESIGPPTSEANE